MRWLLLVLALGGCGNDDGSSGEATQDGAPRPQYFAVLEDLPACNDENADWLVYVAAEKQLRSCRAGTWEPVQLGEPATPQGVTHHYGCDGTEDIDPSASATTKGMSFFATTFASGDWSVSCFDYYFDTAATNSDSSSQQEFYRAGGEWVTEGKMSCVTANTLSVFDVVTLTVVWTELLSGTFEQTTCTEIK